jgi:ParB-like chromosome segregation protein Spo0J
MNLERLATLADSIRRHGPWQPLDVWRCDRRRYQIFDGERRWWAHLHLRYVMSQRRFATVQAWVQSPSDNAAEMGLRRCAEMVHRGDLPAIARGRAIARLEALINGESSETSGVPAGALTHGERARRGYQCNQGDWDRRTGRRLEELIGRGISARTRRHYLSLLSLPPEAQAVAEAADLSEAALRPLLSLDDRAQQILLVHALALDQMTPEEVRREVGCLIGGEERMGEQGVYAPPGGVGPTWRFADEELPDPEQLAADVANLPLEEQVRVRDAAHRLLTFLRALLEAANLES